jgi:Fe2+ or Zn2+ uptake regulation protein
MNFFNTIKLSWFDKKKEERKFTGQNLEILKIFEHYGGGELTPWEVYSLKGNANLKGVPLTSIRRGISSLTRRGFLVKTDAKRLGGYGKINHCWRLNLKKVSYGK